MAMRICFVSTNNNDFHLHMTCRVLLVLSAITFATLDVHERVCFENFYHYICILVWTGEEALISEELKVLIQISRGNCS